MNSQEEKAEEQIDPDINEILHTTTLQCPKCASYYDKAEEVLACIKICKMIGPLKVMLQRTHIDRFNETQARIKKILQSFGEGSGFTTLPIEITRYPAGLSVKINEDKHTSEDIFERITWEHIYRYLETGSISSAPGEFIITMHFADTFINCFDTFFNGQKVDLPSVPENIAIKIEEEEVTG